MALTKITSGLISADASAIDLNIDANTLYIDASENRVGIGLTSPATKLHVSAESTNANTIVRLQQGTTAGNYSAIEVGRTDGSGNVHLTSAVTGGIPIGGIPGILLGSENTSIPAVAIQTPNSSNGHIVFNPKGTEKVRIDSSGNVGIGTSSPAQTLHVNGNAFVSGQTFLGDASGDTVTLTGSLAHAGDFTIDAAGDINLDAAGDQINYKSGGTLRGYLDMSTGGLILRSLTSDADIILQGTDGSSSVNALTLDMSNAGAATFNGNLTVNGADVTIPSNIIHAGDSDTYFGFNDANTFRIVTGGTEALRVDSSQRVGIGTSSPDRQLSINDFSGNGTLGINASTSGASTVYFADGSSGTSIYAGYIQYSHADNSMQFATNGGSERVRIDSSGNFGIGTSSPVTKLHVMDGTAQSGISHTYVYDSTSLSIEAGEPAIQLRAEDSGTHGGSLLWRYGNNVFSAIANPTDDTIDYIYGVTNANDFAVHSGSQMTSYRKIMTLGADGNVGIGDGNLKFASGHGIDFSATGDGSGSMSNELLDDYEEGTWTPTFAGVAAVTIFGARYTKIGQLVMVEAYILGTTQNNTNQFQIGGLPYTSQNEPVYGGGSIGYTYSQDYSDFGSPLIPANASYIYFHRLNGNQPSVTNDILYNRNSGNQYFLFQAIYSTT